MPPRAAILAIGFLAGVGLWAQPPAQLPPIPSLATSGSGDGSIPRLIDDGRLEEARTALRRQALREGASPETLFLEAVILHKEGRYADSNVKLKESLELHREQPDALKLAGLNLVVLGRSRLAIPFFREASELAPDDAVARYYYGMVNLTEYSPADKSVAKRAYDLAETEFHEAIRLDPGYVDAYCSLGLVKEQTGAIEEAIRIYRKAAEVRDRFAVVNGRPELYLGRILLWLERYEESLSVLERGLRISPRSAELLFSLGETLVRLGRDAEALPAFERAAALNPDHRQTHYNLMRLYRKAGRADEAEREMEIVRELSEKERPR